MMHKHPFDEQVKQQLEGYQPSVPSHIWDNINNKKKKKRPFFFFLNFDQTGLAILILLLTMGVGAAYFYFKDKSSDKIYKKLVSENNKNSSDKLNNLTASSSFNQVEKNQSSLVVSNSNQIINTTINETEKINKDQDLNVVNNEMTNHSNAAIRNNRKSLVKSEIENSTTTNQVNPSLKAPTKNNTTEADFDFVNNEKISTNNLTKYSLNKKSEKDQRNKIKSTVKTTDKDASKFSLTETVSAVDVNSGTSNFEKNYQQNLSKRVQEMSLISSTSQFSPKINFKNNPLLSIPCPNDNKAANKNYLDFYTSADYVLRQFNDTPNSKYLKSRKESTSFSSAFSFGLRYTSVFGNGLNLRVGLNFSQINEKFSYSQGNIIQDVFIINNNGDTIGSYQTVSTRYKTSYNRYKTLDIPLTIGYEFNRNKWDFNINSGIIVNIHSWNRGAVLNESLQPVAIGNKDTNSPYQFKSNIGIGGLAGVSCYYRMGQHLKLFGEPYLRYNFSTMNKADISLKQKYHTSGIKLGLRIDL